MSSLGFLIISKKRARGKSFREILAIFGQPFTGEKNFDSVVAGAVGCGWEETNAAARSVAFVIFVRKIAGRIGVGVVVVGEELAQEDVREAGFGIELEDGSGVTQLVAEDVGIKIFNIVRIGEAIQLVFGVLLRMKTGAEKEATSNHENTSADEAEEGEFSPGHWGALGFFAGETSANFGVEGLDDDGGGFRAMGGFVFRSSRGLAGF